MGIFSKWGLTLYYTVKESKLQGIRGEKTSDICPSFLLVAHLFTCLYLYHRGLQIRDGKGYLGHPTCFFVVAKLSQNVSSVLCGCTSQKKHKDENKMRAIAHPELSIQAFRQALLSDGRRIRCCDSC